MASLLRLSQLVLDAGPRIESIDVNPFLRDGEVESHSMYCWCWRPLLRDKVEEPPPISAAPDHALRLLKAGQDVPAGTHDQLRALKAQRYNVST
jgi:hypothetical protein